MSTRTFPSREQRADAYEAVCEESRRILSDPRPLTPLDAKFRIGKTLVFAMVEHRKNEAGTAALLSLDGYWEHAQWFPLKAIRIHRSTKEERFLVVQMPGRLANEKKLPSQPVRPRLTPLIAWSDDARTEWYRVNTYRIRVNDAIDHAARGYRRAPQRMRFGETA